MSWDDVTKNPLLLKHYNLLNDIGVFDFIDSLKIGQRELIKTIDQAYTITTKRSIDELVLYLVDCLSGKFVPTDLVILLNEGIMVNRLKTITFKNLQPEDIPLDIDTLEPFEAFFRKYTSTTSYYLFESEIQDKSILEKLSNISIDILIPIIGHSGLYGLIFIGPKMLGEDYNTEEIAYIDRLMKFISVGIQNNIHYDHSVKDAKTGLYNHSFFIRRVKEELARSRRNKNNCSLIIMDIDHFKNFNDTYGHLVGDEVIISLANVLKHELREEDILSRFGGEEFTVLLPETSSSTALLVAERIRKAVENMEVIYKNLNLKVTISLGVSVYNWVENSDVSFVLNKADEALYQSKENGRNRVTLFKSGLLHKMITLKSRSNIEQQTS